MPGAARGSLTEPAFDAVAVTTSDANDLPKGECVELYIGTAGTLKVTTAAGNDVSYANVVAGPLRLRVKRVWATGTSATGIVAHY